MADTEQEQWQEMPFEELMKRLEEVVALLEKGDIPLERSIELFQEGMRLSMICSQRLEQINQKIEWLVRENGDWVLKPEEQ